MWNFRFDDKSIVKDIKKIVFREVFRLILGIEDGEQVLNSNRVFIDSVNWNTKIDLFKIYPDLFFLDEVFIRGVIPQEGWCDAALVQGPDQRDHTELNTARVIKVVYKPDLFIGFFCFCGH